MNGPHAHAKKFHDLLKPTSGDRACRTRGNIRSDTAASKRALHTASRRLGTRRYKQPKTRIRSPIVTGDLAPSQLRPLGASLLPLRCLGSYTCFLSRPTQESQAPPTSSYHPRRHVSSMYPFGLMGRSPAAAFRLPQASSSRLDFAATNLKTNNGEAIYSTASNIRRCCLSFWESRDRGESISSIRARASTTDHSPPLPASTSRHVDRRGGRDWLASVVLPSASSALSSVTTPRATLLPSIWHRLPRRPSTVCHEGPPTQC